MHWEPTPALYEIECREGFSLKDLIQALGCLELSALGYVKHGGVPQLDEEDYEWANGFLLS